MRIVLIITIGVIAINSSICASLHDSLSINIKGIELDTAVIFIAGETHLLPNNDYIKNSLLEHLINNENVSLIIEEYAPSTIYFIKKSFISNDKSYLSLLHTYGGYLQYHLNSFENLLNLLDRNKENHDLKLYGTGIERTTLIPFIALLELYGDNEIPVHLRLYNEQIKKIAQSGVLPSRKKIFELCTGLKKSIDNDPDEYDRLLGDDFFQFKQIVTGLNFGLSFNMNGKGNDLELLQSRDSLIYQQILEILTDNPGHKAFGQFGISHISKHFVDEWSSVENWSSFCSMLNNSKESPAYQKLITLAIYNKCLSKRREKRLFNGILTQELRYELLSLSNTDFTLIKMSKMDSRYNEYKDLFDYIIIDKNELIK